MFVFFGSDSAFSATHATGANSASGFQSAIPLVRSATDIRWPLKPDELSALKTRFGPSEEFDRLTQVEQEIALLVFHWMHSPASGDEAQFVACFDKRRAALVLARRWPKPPDASKVEEQKLRVLSQALRNLEKAANDLNREVGVPSGEGVEPTAEFDAKQWIQTRKVKLTGGINQMVHLYTTAQGM